MQNGVWLRAAVIVAGLGVAGAAIAGLVISSGLAPTSARPPDSQLTVDVLHGTFKAAVARGGETITVPDTIDLSDPGLIRLGAGHYANTCVSCHGAPGMGQSPLALMMRPAPQHLPAVVGQFTDPELFWILREGVRFSAMPAWPSETNHDEIWAVVAFLRQLPSMTADQFAVLRTGPDPQAPVTPWGTTGPTAATRFGEPSPPADEYAYLAPTAGWTPIGLDERPLGRCTACHGADGSGAATNGHAPNLTLLDKDRITTSLRGYADGSKPSGIMAVVASSLSGDQIEALAAHFAALPDQPSPQPATGDAARGALIAAEGLPQSGVPACLTCHATAARETLPLIRPPAVFGQSQPYLMARLDTLAAQKGRPAPGWNPMPAIAAALTLQDRADLAAYFTSLAPDADASAAAPAAPTADQTATAQGLVAQVCTRCHTAALTGDAAGGIANLTGQTATYLAPQLWAFHEGRRTASQMLQTAAPLTADQIAALAARIGTLPHADLAEPTKGGLPVTDPALQAAGQLVASGDPARGLPACSACHGGPSGAGLAFAPRLEGQGQVYLQRRLGAFAEGRDLAAWSPMQFIATSLTEEERTALAGWYARN